MKKRLSTILFFGNECLATGVNTKAPTLRGLIKEGYDVKALVISQKQNRSRNQKLSEVEIVAKKNGIEIINPSILSEAGQKLRSFGAEAAVLAAFGKIIPQDTIDIFPRGIINIHPSLLPKGRGPTPLEQVILEGVKNTGVSIMQLGQKMDAGPVFVQSKVGLSGQETKQDLADRLIKLGSELILQNLPQILSGKLTAVPQDESNATYNLLIQKDDGILDWEESAERIERKIRAFRGWPKTRFSAGDYDLIITEAEVVKSLNIKAGEITITKNEIVIGCGKDSLRIKRLQPPSKPEMDTKAFLAGYAKFITG